MQKAPQPKSGASHRQEVIAPVYSPRTTYNHIRSSDEALLADLTLNFDPFTINILKNEFKIRKGAMQIVDFVLILKEHLLTWQKDIPFREKKLIRVLIMLFEEIDLNGNNLLEWDEFTNYIIEKATVLNSMKIKEEDIKTYATVPFRVNRKFVNLLTKAIYIPDVDRIATFEEGADEIFFVNHDTGSFNPKPLKVAPPPKEVTLDHRAQKLKEDNQGNPIVHAEKSMILDMIYVQDAKTRQKYLITSSNDGAIRVWKFVNNSFVNVHPDDKEAMYTGEAQTCLAWDPNTQTLYTSQRKGVINGWSLDSLLPKSEKQEKAGSEKPKTKKKDTKETHEEDGDENENEDTRDKPIKPTIRLENGHSDVITDMVPMIKLQLLATCSLDKTIILWNTVEKRKLRTYREHVKGVVSLAFNEALILLISAGYDHHICIWNPYIENPIFKISNHNFPLVSVKFVEGTQHFVSLDTSGTVMVWDIKKFNNIQTFTIETQDEKHKFRSQAFTYIPKPLKLAFVGRSVFIYEYDKNYNPTSVDDTAVLTVHYRALDNTIITPAGNKVKVWNALNGDIKKIFADITTAEITSFTLDHLKKRCLIGFSDGEAAVFNIINGAKVKTLPKHQGEVNFIFEAHNLALLITASSVDSTIRMSTDTEINDAEQKRMITITDQIITSVTYKAHEKMIVVGTRNGQISFWEAETAKNIGVCNTINEEITNICPLKDYEYIWVGTTLGKVYMLSTPPAPFRFAKVYEFSNFDPEVPLSAVYIQDLIWAEENNSLFIADEKCYIKRLDMTSVMKDIIEHKKNRANKSDDSSNLRGHLNPPTIANQSPKIMWAIKAHTEAVKSIEYVDIEELIFSTGLDKKVKVWNAKNGEYVDSLQQKYDKADPTAVAYKKSGTVGILGPDINTRVDKEYTKLTQEERDELVREVKAELEREKKKAEEESQFTYQYRAPKIDKLQSRENSVKSGATKGKIGADTRGKGYPASGNISMTSAREISPSKRGFDYNRMVVEQWMMSNNATMEKVKASEELEKEIFDPYYNWNNIDLKALTNLRSTPWKLHVNFDRNKQEFEEHIQKIIREIQAIEEDEADLEEKMGGGQQFKMKGFEVEEPDYPKPRAQTAAVESMSRGLEGPKEEAKANDPMRSTMMATNKTSKMFEDSSKKSILKKDTDWASKTASKFNTNLHRTELKGKVLDKNRPNIALSEDEVNAAYRLAAALSNYDKDDTRNLKFSEITVKQQMKKKADEKNFLTYNIQHLAEFTQSSSLKKNVAEHTNQMMKNKSKLHQKFHL